MTTITNKKKSKGIKSANWQFWLIIAIPLLYVIIFNYVPMGGIVMAFQNFSPSKGLLGSDWVGLDHFKTFLTSPSSQKVIKNTLILGIYTIVASFPLPILLAIGINEVRAMKFKKTVQMVTYAPYFISTTVMIGLLMQLTDMRIGLINRLIMVLGGSAVNFFGKPGIFPSLYVWSGIWQTTGYDAIIFIAALSGVSQELKEAAVVDGASRLKRIWHVDLPAIKPTIVILLIFKCGQIMNIGFEKVYLMQNSANLAASEVISTFVYKVGLQNASYSFSTAVGIFNSLIGFILLVLVNQVSKKLTDSSLW